MVCPPVLVGGGVRLFVLSVLLIVFFHFVAMVESCFLFFFLVSSSVRTRKFRLFASWVSGSMFKSNFLTGCPHSCMLVFWLRYWFLISLLVQVI